MDPDELIKKLQNWADDPSSEPGIDSWAKGMDKRKIQTFDAKTLIKKNGHYENKKTVDNPMKSGYNQNVQQNKIATFSSTLEISKKVESGEINLKSNHEHYEKHPYKHPA